MPVIRKALTDWLLRRELLQNTRSEHSVALLTSSLGQLILAFSQLIGLSRLLDFLTTPYHAPTLHVHVS